MNTDQKQLDRDRIKGLLIKVGDERKKVVGNIKGLVSVLQEDIDEHRDTILMSFIEWYVITQLSL